MTSNRGRLVLAFVTGMSLAACNVVDLPNPLRRPTAAPAVPVDLPLDTQIRLRDFDTAVRMVREQYANPRVLDAGWQTVVSDERARVARGAGDTGLLEALRVVAGSLNDVDLAVAAPVSATAPAGFAGIGVRVDLPREQKPRILIMHVYPNSPSESAGLKAHDAIVAIEGAPVRYEDRATVTSRLRGPAGTDVKVTVQTPGSAPREVTLTRRAITPSEATIGRRLPGTSLGYIRPGFAASDDLLSDVVDELRRLQAAAPIDGLVLDLRTMVSDDFPLESMLSVFVNGEAGTRVVRGQRQPEKVDIAGRNILGSQTLPLAILVSEYTSGPVEAFAGMLQDLGRARLIGNTTAGRTGVIATGSLPNSGIRLSVPVGDVRGVKNRSWYGSGVTPDVQSARTWDQITDADDPQLAQAQSALLSR